MSRRVGLLTCSLSNATLSTVALTMDNADLEKLKVSQGKLLPKFKPSVTSYSVTIGSNVQEIKLSPLTADGGASYVVKVSTPSCCRATSENLAQTNRSFLSFRVPTAARWCI